MLYKNLATLGRTFRSARRSLDLEFRCCAAGIVSRRCAISSDARSSHLPRRWLAAPSGESADSGVSEDVAELQRGSRSNPLVDAHAQRDRLSDRPMAQRP